MTTIIGIKNCNTMKKAFVWLEKHHINFEFRDVKKNPLSDDELKDLASRVGLNALINRKGMMWRKLGLAQQHLDDHDLLMQLTEHQNMIKRPVLRLEDDSIHIGFDERSYEELFR